MNEKIPCGINYKIHLSYKDILLVPYDKGVCTIESRSDPVINTSLGSIASLQIPIISAPMDTVTGVNMAIAMSNLGALGIYTRHINDSKEEEKQCSAIEKIRSQVGTNGNVACAIGVKCDVYKRTENLIKAGQINILCLDIANGNHIFMLDAIKEVRKLQGKYPFLIMAGNVATPRAALRLVEAGANIVKIGIGPGGACTTRRVTGFGVPQLTAVMQCSDAVKSKYDNVKIVADGGIRHSGDVVKAIWAGADAVMMGYALAGHDESPQVSNVPKSEVGIPKRMYRGMSSRTVSSRFDIAAEGVCFEIPNRGPVKSTITEYAAAIKSACSYANAMNLQELRDNVYAIRVSTMSQEESDPIAGE